ncbi:hypothetical protein LEMLEM_LOCUS19783, partial [Lemmus lemmus]
IRVDSCKLNWGGLGIAAGLILASLRASWEVWGPKVRCCPGSGVAWGELGSLGTAAALVTQRLDRGRLLNRAGRSGDPQGACQACPGWGSSGSRAELGS